MRHHSHRLMPSPTVTCRPSLFPAALNSPQPSPPPYPQHTCPTLLGPPPSPRTAALHLDCPKRTMGRCPILSKALCSRSVGPRWVPGQLGTLASQNYRVGSSQVSKLWYNLIIFQILWLPQLLKDGRQKCQELPPVHSGQQ